MRTGGSLPPLSPQWYITDSSGYIYLIYAVSQLHRKYHIYLFLSSKSSFFFFISSSLFTFVKFPYQFSFSHFWDQALDLLVSVSSIHYCTYTSDLSTSSSSRGLTIFRYGISYLEVSFTLRCFQRLSAPHFATLLCPWQNNRCTIGASIPVLSY